MEMVETTPVISLLAIVLVSVWGFIGGPTAFLPAFLMYYLMSPNVSDGPTAQDAAPATSQAVLTPRPIPVP